jgi:hypothetical protein
MPKNTVTDPITDQEMAFAHLVLSGTMNDRQAAEAAGLNPDTAAYTKAKHRVRDYMIEHRAAVKDKLVDLEADLSRRAAEGLRKLNLGRDQVLARLWELANLSHELTRGSIAGQIKAIVMIVAIEGLIPSGTMNDRRLSPSAGAEPAAPPVQAQIYQAEWLPKQQHQAVDEEPGDPMTGAKTPPTASQVPQPESTLDPVNLDRPQPSPVNPFINPPKLNRVPEATDFVFDTVPDTRLPFSIQKGRFGKRR